MNMEALPEIPLQLAHPAFGKFLEVFRGNLGKPSKVDFLFFKNLCEGNNDRALWQKYTGIKFEVGDGSFYADPVSGALLLMKTSGSYDSRTAGNFRSYWSAERRLLFGGSCLPGLVLEQFGKQLRVTGFVEMSSRVSFQPLTPFVSISLSQLYNLKAAEQSVLLCLAVKCAVMELCSFYRNYTGHSSLVQAGIPYSLRHRAASQGAVPKPITGLVYTLLDVVVKYVQEEYGEVVHRAWAAAGFAPELKGVERLPGGWLEVTMEKLGDEWMTLEEHPRAQEIRPRVLQALDRAHKVAVGIDEHGMRTYGVHGDMRGSNVMVRGDGEAVKFIHFDWAKEEGKAYPLFATEINCPTGAEDCKPMLQWHDRELLGKGTMNFCG